MKRPSLADEVPRDSVLFDFLLENTPDQIYFKDREGRFLRISRAVAEYMNVASPHDLIGRTDFDFWSEETARAAADDERRVMETGEPIVGRIERLVYPDGRVVWDYTSKLPLRNAAGEIIGICGINKDFTKVREMEEALREERNRLRVLTAELAERNAQIEADLRMARTVQEAMLPPDYDGSASQDSDRLSFSHLYLPAEEVGGDLYHIFPLSKGRAGIFICDVMGHGVRAALITAVIRALIGELRPMLLNPGRFLSALNRRVRSILERVDEPFVATAFYFVADPVEGVVRFANAGHPRPARLHTGDGEVKVLDEERKRGGPALGLIEDFNYQTASGTFDRGDRIVLFTDGVYEVDGPGGEEFGLTALHEALAKHSELPADELFAAVLEDVKCFSEKSSFDDDVCLVSIERVGG